MLSPPQNNCFNQARMAPVARCRPDSKSDRSGQCLANSREIHLRFRSASTPAAQPSARVSRCSVSMIFPARMLAAKAAECNALTPKILTLGFAIFKTAPTPETSPPPPRDIKTLSTWESCASISIPIVPCPAMISGSL